MAAEIPPEKKLAVDIAEACLSYKPGPQPEELSLLAPEELEECVDLLKGGALNLCKAGRLAESGEPRNLHVFDCPRISSLTRSSQAYLRRKWCN